jgi:uncharacterized Ntn-hydrolase superfamily protein
MTSHKEVFFCNVSTIECMAFEMKDVSGARLRRGGTPLAHTYSIVAFDPKTRDIGVGVQSHWFNVGAIVPWGKAGVGVVATQSFVNPSFGPLGLEMMKKMSPKEVVDRLIAADKGRNLRQLAVLDSKGRAAAYTGRSCIPAAGHLVGKTYSVQANMMLNDSVWPEISKAFVKTKGPLAERMVAALEAGEKAGGDIRGRQSAAILVVRGESTGNPWEDRLVDLRVDDSPEPLVELKRLLKVHRAYEHMNNGDLALETGDAELALRHYSSAEKLFPDNIEMRFWHAAALTNNGRFKEALPLFGKVFSEDDNWREFVVRIAPLGLLRVNDKQLKRILRM